MSDRRSRRPSIILQTVARFALYLTMILSIYLLLRGHNAPGGGFIAGLLTASGMILQAVAFNRQTALNLIPVNPRTLIALGLALALSTGIYSLILGTSFLTHRIIEYALPFLGHGEILTALFFDIGVYLLVIGATKLIILTIADEPVLARAPIREYFERWSQEEARDDDPWNG